jgi:hypothetical protein
MLAARMTLAQRSDSILMTEGNSSAIDEPWLKRLDVAHPASVQDHEASCSGADGQRSTLSSTISARNLPCSAVMRPTVMGRRKRRGPALPGLKKSVPFFASILGWCE